ncbi:MAG: polysaccharide lyase family 7 protein [Maricaulaceae bacterium]
MPNRPLFNVKYPASKKILLLGCAGFAAVSFAALSITPTASAGSKAVPAENFDLSHWNITLPVDKNRDGKVDSVSVKKLQKYSHPDYFYLDDNGHMVFAAPNKGTTTKNTSNVRSELRYMKRGTNTRIKTHSATNNFTVAANPNAAKYGSIGGRMDATLKVDHVSTEAGNREKATAYSVVVGQIHAVKYKNTSSGFGYGNEPIKIYYKKLPEHETGSLFWTYELNLAKDDPKRKDIAYPVFGNTWKNLNDPGDKGIALGEEFSYTINVYKNNMFLTFTNERLGTETFVKSLISQHDAYGDINPDANKFGYAVDSNYFKAGVYNQCSTSTKGGFWSSACPGTGDWETDKANGHYAQATFSKLVVGPATPQE